MRIFVTIATLGVILGTWNAGSAELCDEPVADWKPRESLEAKLEAVGWHIRSIKAADGCYKADAIDPDGHDVQALFNPKTFEPVIAGDEKHS